MGSHSVTNPTKSIPEYRWEWDQWCLLPLLVACVSCSILHQKGHVLLEAAAIGFIWSLLFLLDLRKPRLVTTHHHHPFRNELGRHFGLLFIPIGTLCRSLSSSSHLTNVSSIWITAFQSIYFSAWDFMEAKRTKSVPAGRQTTHPKSSESDGLTWRSLPLLVSTTFILPAFIPDICEALVGLSSIAILDLLLHLFPGSFNQGEAAVCSSVLALFLNWSVPLLGFTYSPSASIKYELKLLSVTVILGAFALSIGVSWISHIALFTTQRSISVGGFILLSVVGIMEPFLWSRLHQEPVTWVFNQFGEEYRLFGYWSLLLVVGILGSRLLPLRSINTKRKYFHLMAICIFVPGLLYNISLMRLAFCVALAAFIVLEALRVNNVWPFGEVLTHYTRGFLDEKEGGVLIVSHMYLLVGCALPVWLEQGVPSGKYAWLRCFAGILVLGVGDSFASIIGRRMGSLKWGGRPSSNNKSVQGTLAFVLSVFICIRPEWQSWCVLGVLFMTAMVEALSAIHDNLILSLYFVAWLHVVESYHVPLSSSA